MSGKNALSIAGLILAAFAMSHGIEKCAAAHHRVNVIDYGADPTGARDSTAAFNRAALDACAAGVATIVVPPGRYTVIPAKTWDFTQQGVTLHCSAISGPRR